jgi:hypothetical protein
MNRREALLGLGACSLAWTLPARASGTKVRVFKSATCGCCTTWVKHLEAAGFVVDATNVADPGDVRREHRLADRYASCHTALVEGYVLEGHVPATDVKRMLAERPAALGLAVPGMPAGSPGMEGSASQPFDVLLVDREGNARVYARYPAR